MGEMFEMGELQANSLLLVAFDLILEKQCKAELNSFCQVQSINSMEVLETSDQTPSAIVYLMDFSSSNHLHNIEFIRNKYPKQQFFIITTSVSIPLLQQAIHLGVNDVFIYPFSPQEKQSLLSSLNNQTTVECFIDEMEMVSDVAQTQVNKDNPIVSLLDIIERDYVKGPTLQDLSHDIHLSPSRICHLFKDLCGIAYSHYLLCRKLEEGERLLMDNNSSVTTVAYQLGFSNPSHFCRSFKEHFNITPSAYSHAGNELKYSSIYKRYQRLRAELLPNLASMAEQRNDHNARKQSVVQ